MPREPTTINVYKIAKWEKINTDHFDSVEDAMLFVMAQPESGKYAIELPDWTKIIVHNRDVTRTIPPLNLNQPSRSMVIRLVEKVIKPTVQKE